MAKEINVPAAPAVLPEDLRKKYASTYTAAFKEAKADDENASDGDCHQAARKEANRLLRVAEPTTHAEATKLPKWHVHHSKEEDGVLKIVTIDGKKYKFDVPKKPAPPAEPK
jgi:hypothetical protein